MTVNFYKHARDRHARPELLVTADLESVPVKGMAVTAASQEFYVAQVALDLYKMAYNVYLERI